MISPVCAGSSLFANFGGSESGLSPLADIRGLLKTARVRRTLELCKRGAEVKADSVLLLTYGAYRKPPACAERSSYANFGGSESGLSPLVDTRGLPKTARVSRTLK